MANDDNNELEKRNNQKEEFDIIPNSEGVEEEYTGTCYWCGLCSETNGVCVRNNQSLLSKTKKRY